MFRECLRRPTVLRVILFILNAIFIAVGITIIVLGVYIKIDGSISAVLDKLDSVSSLEGQSLGYLAFVMIGGGIITLIIAFVGCMGALWMSRCVLIIYSTVLIMLMILELVGLILAFVYKSRLESVYKNDLYTVFSKALNESNTEVLDAFTELEKKLKCCGVNGINDYHGREPKNPDCYRYRKGCSAAIIKLFDENLPIIGTVLGAVLLFEFLCLVTALALTVALKNYNDYTHIEGRRLSPIRMSSLNRSQYS